MRSSILNIAHRGARSLAPENTIAAARKALALGADMWELDVGVTADGELILIHDTSLVRTTNAQILFPERAPWDFADFYLREIKSLDAGSFFVDTDPFGQIAAGAISPDELAAMRGEPIPTLEEALRFTRDHNWRVNVEIKQLAPTNASFPVVEKVVTMIEQLDMVDQVLLSSFVHPYLQQAKTLNSELATAVLLYQSEADDQPKIDPIKLLTELKSRVYHPYYKIIDAKQVGLLRQAGFEINVWTVNETDDMQAFIEAGVTGIITDFPQRLQRLLLK
jgi:glycerophosphoryl diester phosphodiesterase